MERPSPSPSAVAQTDKFINVEIRDFGPISSASIRLSPLTVFVGPSNSGKSYIALLLHSIINAQARFPITTWRNKSAALTCRNIIRDAYDGGTKKALLNEVDSQALVDALLRSTFRDMLQRNIERNFGSSLKEMARNGQEKSTITVLENGLTGRPRLEFGINRKGGDLEASVKFRGDGQKIEMVHEPRQCTIRFIDNATNTRKHDHGGASDNDKLARATYPLWRDQYDDPDIMFHELSRVLAHAIARRMRRNTVYGRSIYFPAARSSIMETYKVLSAGIVTYAPRTGQAEGLGIPGTIADLVAGIIRLGNRRTRFFDLASSMEREILSGDIRATANTPGKYTTISYQFDGKSIPMSRASSSVSEIAPLSLYLKHIVMRGNVLIIEEPEAHLHPASIVTLAKYIVRLVRGGLYILLTTHSPYLLEKLGKYLLAAKLPEEERVNGLGYGRDDYLKQSEVSAYLFKKERDGVYSAEEIDKDSESGISQEEFVKVDLELSDETAFIHYRTGEG